MHVALVAIVLVTVRYCSVLYHDKILTDICSTCTVPLQEQRPFKVCSSIEWQYDIEYTVLIALSGEVAFALDRREIRM